MKRFVFLKTLLLLVFFAQAQGSHSLQLSINYDTISMNELLAATYTFSGTANNLHFIPPQFEDFNLMGSNTQNSFSMINGQMSTTMTYVYHLRPKKQGVCLVPAGKMDMGNRHLLTSNEAKVYVLQEYKRQESYAKRYPPNRGFDNLFPEFPAMPHLDNMFQFPDINSIFNDPFLTPSLPPNTPFNPNRSPRKNAPIKPKDQTKVYKI